MAKPWNDLLTNISSGFQSLGSSIGSKATQLGSSISQGFQQLRQPTQAPLAPLGQKITQGIQQLRQPVPAPIQIRIPDRINIAKQIQAIPQAISQTLPRISMPKIPTTPITKITTPQPFVGGLAGQGLQKIQQNFQNKPIVGGLVGQLFATPTIQRPQVIKFAQDELKKMQVNIPQIPAQLTQRPTLDLGVKDIDSARLKQPMIKQPDEPLVPTQYRDVIDIYRNIAENKSEPWTKTLLKGIQDSRFLPFIGQGEDLIKTLNEPESEIVKQSKAIEPYSYKGQTAYQIGRIMGQIPEYAAEFLLSGSAYTGVRIATSKVVTQALTKTALPVFVKKAVSNVLGTLTGALAQTPLAAGFRIADDLFKYMLPQTSYQLTESPQGKALMNRIDRQGKPFHEAFARAFGQNYVEILTERMGVIVGKPLGLLKQATFGKWLQLRGITDSTMLSGLKQKVAWDGLLGEVFEEEIGLPAQAKIQEFDYKAPWTPEGMERLLVETLGIGAFSGIAKTTDFAIQQAGKYQKEINEKNILNYLRDLERERIISGAPVTYQTPTTPTVPEIPTAPAIAPQPETQFRVVEPPVTNIQPREIVSVKSKYEGVQTANAVIRPDGTGSIAVELKPEARGKGLGTDLVKELETILKDKGITQVEIASVPESVGFWEKQGYVQTGQPAQAGLVNMQKALEAEPAGLKVEQAPEKQITVEEATQAMGTSFSDKEIQSLTREAKEATTPQQIAEMGVNKLTQMGATPEQIAAYTESRSQIDGLADFVVGERKEIEKLMRTEAEAEMRRSYNAARELYVPAEQLTREMPRGAEAIIARLRAELGFATSALRQLEQGQPLTEVQKEQLRSRGLDNITREEIDAIQDFVDDIGVDMFDDVGLSIRTHGGKQGQFDYVKSLITLFRENIAQGKFDRTTIHEMWHSLSRYLPAEDTQIVNSQFLKEKAEYVKNNPWFEEFLNNGKNLTTKQAEDLINRFPEVQKYLEPVFEQYDKTGYRQLFDDSNYRFKNISEWFAETATDKSFERFANMDAKTKSIFAHIKEIIRKWIQNLQRHFGFDQTNRIVNDFFTQKNREMIRPTGLGETTVDLLQKRKPITPEGQEPVVVKSIEQIRGSNPVLKQMHDEGLARANVGDKLGLYSVIGAIDNYLTATSADKRVLINDLLQTIGVKDEAELVSTEPLQPLAEESRPQTLKELRYDPSRLEKTIMPPNTVGNPANGWEAQIRYKGLAADKKLFSTEQEAQKFLDTYEFKGMNVSVAEDYLGTSFDPFKRTTTKPTEEIIQPEEIPETPVTPIVKTPAPQDVIDFLVESIPANSVEARENYDQAIQEFDLPTFEELEQTASQVVRAEREIVDELKKEAGASDVTQLDQIGQFASTIRKAVREYKQITKRTGVVDIATMTEKVPDLDGAINALRSNGIEVNTMEDLIALVPRLPVWRTRKAGVRVGKSKVARLTQLINSGATSEQLLSELESPMSPTRQAIRTRITRGISSEKIGVEGQLRYRFEETGEPILTEKAAFGETKGPSPEISKEIPAGQKILPETGVIHPKVMERLVATQVRKIRTLRERAGITMKEFNALSEQLIGKKVLSLTATYPERQRLVDRLSSENREQLVKDLAGIQILFNKEKAQIISQSTNNMKSSSPLENDLNINKEIMDIVYEVNNLQKSSEIWDPIEPAKKGQFLTNVRSFLIPFVREQLAARLAGVDQVFHGPLLAILNTTEQIGRTFKDMQGKFNQNLTAEEKKAVAFLTTGVKGKTFRGIFNREATVKEKQYSQYLRENLDNIYHLLNMGRRLAGKSDMKYRKDYLPWILDKNIAELAKIDTRINPTKERTKALEAFNKGVFRNDLDTILTMYGQAAENFMRMDLGTAFLKPRADKLSQISNAADIFGKYAMERDIYGTRDLLSSTWKNTVDTINQKIGQAVFPKVEKLTSEQQAFIKQHAPEYKTDSGFKEMVDKGYVLVPRSWTKIPDLSGATIKIIYQTKLGFGNSLFSVVNLAQPALSLPFTSGRDLAKAYWQFGQIIGFLNPTLKTQTVEALRKGGVLDYEKYGGEVIGDKVDYLNNFLDKISKFTGFNMVWTERVNRTVVLLAGMNHLVRVAEAQGMNLSKEGIVKAATEMTGYINLKPGKGYAPFIVRNGPAGVLYLFKSYGIQWVDIMSRAIGITFNNAEKKAAWKYFFTSSNAPAQDIVEIQNKYADNKAFIKKLLYFGIAAFATAATVYLFTSSKEAAKRYLFGFTPQDLAGFTDNPYTQLINAALGYAQSPEKGNQELLKALNNIIKITTLDRLLKVKIEGEDVLIRDELGRRQYDIDPSRKVGILGLPEDWATRVFGVSTLPQSAETSELYKEGLESERKRDERTKKLMNYVLNFQKIVREQGDNAATDYLNNLNLEPEDIDRIMDIMEEELKETNKIDRQLKGDVDTRALHIYKELSKFKTEAEAQKYIDDLINKGLLTEETWLGLYKILSNPPEPGPLKLLNKLLGVSEAKALEPEEQLNLLFGSSTQHPSQNKIFMTSKGTNLLQQKMVESKAKLMAEMKGETTFANNKIIYPDEETGNAKIINLNPLLTAKTGLEKAKQQSEIYKTARGEIFNHPTLTDEQKEQVYAMLGVKSEDVTLDAIASEDSQVKAAYFEEFLVNKPYDEILTTLASNRIESISGDMVANDATIDELVEREVISYEDGKYLKTIKYNKAGKNIGSSSRPKKITFPKLSFKAVSLPKPTPIKITKPQQFKPLQIKINKIPKPPSVRFTSSQFSSKMPTVRFPKMAETLGAIGRTP